MHTAIEAVRALLPLLERDPAPEPAPIRDAVSQLQMAYAQLSGGGGAAEPAKPGDEPKPETGPPKSSSRLWTPGR